MRFDQAISSFHQQFSTFSWFPGNTVHHVVLYLHTFQLADLPEVCPTAGIHLVIPYCAISWELRFPKGKTDFWEEIMLISAVI